MKQLSALLRVHPLHAIAAVCLILMALLGIAKLAEKFSPSDPAHIAQNEAELAVSAAEAVATAELDNSELTFTSIAPPADGEFAEAPMDEYVLVEAPKPEHLPAQTPEAPAVAPVITPAVSPAASSTSKQAALCWNCGVITHIEEIASEGKGTGLGTVSGAIIGGIAGHQMGGGDGKKVMTAVGAIGGAIAGNTIEKNMQRSFSYRVHLYMDHGGTQALNFPYPPHVSVGDTVKVENGELIRN